MVLTFRREDCWNCCCPSWTEWGIRVCSEQREMERKMEMVYQLCVLVFCAWFHCNWKIGYLYGFLVMWWATQRKPIENSFWLGILCIDITKSELNGGVAYGFAVFLSHSGKKQTASMTVYLFKVSYDSLWCQSLMVWYTAFLPAILSILYVKSAQNFQQIHKLTFIWCKMSPIFSQKNVIFIIF